MEPPYQGFALRWANRRPFGAHIFDHGRGTKTGYMNSANVNDFLAAHTPCAGYIFISRQFLEEADCQPLLRNIPNPQENQDDPT